MSATADFPQRKSWGTLVCALCTYHKVWCWSSRHGCLVRHKAYQFVASTNLLLGVSGYGTDLLEWSRHLFLPTGDEETGCGHCIVSSTLQLFLFMNLLVKHLTAILTTHKQTNIHTWHSLIVKLRGKFTHTHTHHCATLQKISCSLDYKPFLTTNIRNRYMYIERLGYNGTLSKGYRLVMSGSRWDNFVVMILSHLDALGQVQLRHHVGNFTRSSCQTPVCRTHLIKPHPQ